MNLSRRRALLATLGLSGVAATAIFARNMMGRRVGQTPSSLQKRTFIRPLKIPAQELGVLREGVRYFDMSIQSGSSQFFSGVSTPTWGINAPYLGPTLRLRRGEEVAIRWFNRLKEATTMHGHGMHLPAVMDGNIHQVIEPGKSWVARYKVNQKACTNWYHPHMMGRTAEHVIRGLGGVIIIDDEESLAHPLPKRYGIDDIPLVVQDRLFTRDGNFAYPRNMMTVMHGFFGNTLLVNGTVGPYFEAEAGLLRLRLLNASNARVYRFAMSDRSSMKLIAGDNSFLERPVDVDEILLSPAERAEVVLDLRNREGETLYLIDRNSKASILQIRINKEQSAISSIPKRLTTLDSLKDAYPVRSRSFVLSAQGPGRLLINNRAMDPKRIDIEVPLGEYEIWTIKNGGMGMGGMMGMNHNFHMHATHFRVISRNGDPNAVRVWERAYKDTVFLAPGDEVKLLVRHSDYADANNPYMYHCHILEHEDAGMMGQFTVV